MKFYDIQQNSGEWQKAKAGRITASKMDKVILKSGALSKQCNELADRLIAERWLGRPLDTFKPNFWMERGMQYEQDARNWYAFKRECDLLNGGFFTNDTGFQGASPDARVSIDGKVVGGVEIKVPAEWNHVTNLISQDIVSDYFQQAQMQIHVCGFEFVDLVTFCPDLPSQVYRVLPDEKFQQQLAQALQDFEGIVNQRIEKLVQQGYADAAIFALKEPAIYDMKTYQNAEMKPITSPMGG